MQAFAKGTAGDKKLSLKARSDLDTQMIEYVLFVHSFNGVGH